MTMAAEKQLQEKVRKWLKSKGCLVLVMSPAPGVPSGWPDIMFFYEGLYGALELKASKTAKKQPLQDYFVEKLSEWSYARFVWPENWDEVRAELDELLR